MDIRLLSQKRGIFSLYDGSRYVIYSSVYGVVAESTKIERFHDEDYCETSVSIEFDVCEWLGCWSVYDIIRRGVEKMEREILPEKEVCIVLHQVKGEQMSLKRRLVMSTEKY